LVLALGMSSLGEGVLGPLFPVFVVQILHGGASEIGNLMTLQAVGGMVGGLLIGRIGSRAIRRGVFGCATLLHGCVCAAFFNAPRLHTSLALELGLFALSGATGISALTGFAGLTQLRSPDRFRGRVSSALSFAGSIFGLVGVIIALAAVNRFGVLAVVTLQGVGYVCGGIVILTMLPPPSPRR